MGTKGVSILLDLILPYRKSSLMQETILFAKIKGTKKFSKKVPNLVENGCTETLKKQSKAQGL